MRKIWGFLKEASNRTVLSWLGVGILAFASFLGFGDLKKKEEPKLGTGASMPKGSTPLENVAPQSAALPPTKIGQNAQAGEGGFAINANDNAQVTISVKP